MKNEIKLRALEPEDLELVYQIENDPTLWLWSGDSQPFSRYALRCYIETQESDIYRDNQLRQVIEVDGQAAGIVDLTDFNPHHLRAEVGIVVLPEYRRKGVASQALRLLIEYGQMHLHLATLYATVSEQNTPAQALFLHAGYKEVGRLLRWIEGQETAILYQWVK